MQGNQGQVIQLLASGSCYGSCTRLKSSLIEVIFSAGRYLTTVPWPPLWQFEKLKEVCIPRQHSLLDIFFKEVVPMAPWRGWWDSVSPRCPASPGCHQLPHHLLCIILGTGHRPWGKHWCWGTRGDFHPVQKQTGICSSDFLLLTVGFLS